MNIRPTTVTPGNSIVSGLPSIEGGPFPPGVVMAVTSPFGPRTPFQTPAGPTSSFHYGIDAIGGQHVGLLALTRARVLVAEDGHPEVGTWVRAQDEDDPAYTWDYLHMVTGSLLVAVGDLVAPGQPIGELGSTGLSTADHLHLTISWQGHAVDPLPLLVAAPNVGGTIPPAPQPPPPPVFASVPRWSQDGVALVVFGGGSQTLLEATARAAGAKAVWAQDAGGTYRLLIVGGPAFVSVDFPAAFSGPTSVTLIR